MRGFLHGSIDALRTSGTFQPIDLPTARTLKPEPAPGTPNPEPGTRTNLSSLYSLGTPNVPSF